nr:plasmid maintenance system antidote protein [uncultured Flavobacterium sp.]
MRKTLDLIKGIHPGFVLERELQKRNLGKGQFAISVGEFPQTLTAITKGKRRMNIPLAMKIEKSLSMEEGYLMILQVYYDIEQEKKKAKQKVDDSQKENHPDLKKLRTILFWDTDMNKIDWQKQKKAVIKRVFERGNEQEKKEITHFYGTETVTTVLSA